MSSRLIEDRGFWIGRRYGAYRITRAIGRGGMGLVFEAVRDDDEFRKTVALKIAPPWQDAATVRERFRVERQILAGLEHVNIARFLDGGTDHGEPYFVMEYVEGVPITAYCRDRQLGLRPTIELFRRICAAVHFAHESLVVHRDLKARQHPRHGRGHAQAARLRNRDNPRPACRRKRDARHDRRAVDSRLHEPGAGPRTAGHNVDGRLLAGPHPL